MDLRVCLPDMSEGIAHAGVCFPDFLKDGCDDAPDLPHWDAVCQVCGCHDVIDIVVHEGVLVGAVDP